MDRNTDEKLNVKRLMIAALAGLLAIPGLYFPLLMLMLPAFLGFMLCAWGAVCFSLAAVSAAAAIFVFCGFDAVAALYLLATFLPASAVMGVMLRRRAPYRMCVAGTAAALGLGYYATLCLPSLLSTGDPFAGMYESVKAVTAELETLANAAAISEVAQGVTSYFNVLLTMVPQITVTIICLLSMGFGFLDTLAARAAAKKSGCELRPMAPFRRWRLSRNFSFGMMIMLTGALICLLLELKNAEAISAAVQCVLILPLALCGFCFLDFQAVEVKGRGAASRALRFAATFLLLPYSVYGLALVGLVERIFKLRERYLDSHK